MDQQEGARRIIRNCIGIKPEERVLLITDERRPPAVEQALYEACREVGVIPERVCFDGILNQGQPPETIAAAMERADVVLCITTNTLGYSMATRACTQRGGRVVAMTEATEELLTNGALEADFSGLRGRVRFVMEAFDRAEEGRVTTRKGTELTFRIGGRMSHCCMGTCLEPGIMAAVPDMEVYIAPVEGTMDGIWIADVMGTGMGLLTEPIRLEIQNGEARAITGGDQANQLRQRVENVPGGKVVAEFAIGLNPCATPTGSIVIDEGIYGTGHFALGSNTGFGGNNSCTQHLDLVYEKPTIYLDGNLFMEDGVLIESCGSIQSK